MMIGGIDLNRYLNRLQNDPNAMWIFALVVGALALFLITRGKWR